LNHIRVENTSDGVVNLLSFSPLHIFWAGREAVILFFVLSGFVLALPFLSPTRPGYVAYSFKRVCRIYIPYITAMILAVVAFNITPKISNEGFSLWYKEIWKENLALDSLVGTLLLTGYKSHVFNTSAWSLVHEIRISLLMPFLVYAVSRLRLKKTLALFIPLTIGSGAVLRLLGEQIGSEFWKYHVGSLGDTCYYMIFFVVGILIALYKSDLSRLYHHSARWLQASLLPLALSLYCFEWIAPSLSAYKSSKDIVLLLLAYIEVDYVVTMGVALLLVLAMNSRSVERFLNLGPIQYLGKISYSIYLVHAIILIVMMNLFPEIHAPFKTVATVVPLAIIAGSFFYRFVEVPSIDLGKRLSAKFAISRHAPGQVPCGKQTDPGRLNAA
jgi:peptidoglycan/LPS O-acetylase OafA/YrhL